MNQIVRVVGESIGYGFVGLYLKEPSTGRMRVATYIDVNLDYNTFKMSNPGNDWDILMLITGNPADMKKIGGIPIPVSFGMDAFQAGEGKSSPLKKTAVGDIWKVDGALLTLVQLNGSVTGGYLRVSDPIDNHCMNTSDFLSPQSEIFCHQALWIYANQAAIAIENAYLIERARSDINERARVEKDLAATQDELEKRILQRTQQLEQLNTELRTEIMEREVAQQELDQQTQFLRQVLDTNPTLIYARDRNGKYTLANDAAARFEGLTVDDILGKTDNELNHDLGQIIRWRHEDLDVMENRRDIILSEERVVDTHGMEHFLQTIKRPIVGPNGKIDQILGVSVEITARKKAEERVVQANSELAQAYDATIEGWSRALDLRDRETEGHSLRVTNMTLRLAKWMGIDQSEHLNLRRGALLHDIGKMGIPDEILFKKGTLNDEEWVIMRKHPSYAYEMLKPIDYLHPALFIPKYHHEKWDGSGYPEKLGGELIPLPARIFAIVDVWDALTSDRPYRVAWGVDDVLDYIKRNSGTHFDPKVVDTFVQNLDDIVFHNPIE
jgi:PAS domain S-box-containing protein/putative nucleotidyltransferase with HDIG domain